MHADFVVDKLTSALVRTGPGPFTTAPRLTIRSVLDGAGQLTLSMPASDPRTVLFVPNTLNYVMAVVAGETGDMARVGLIQERTTNTATAELQLRGPNLAHELTFTNVGKLTLESAPGSGLPMPAADILDTILDGTGWTAIGVPSRAVYHKFGNEKTLLALGKLAEICGDHWRLSHTVPRQIEWLAAGADGYVPAASGLTAKETPDPSADACVIAGGSLVLIEDGGERITRIYPLGGGNADAQLYINASTLGTANPGNTTGDYVYGDYTLHIDMAAPWKSYIKHTANDAAGSIGDVVEIRDVVAIGTTAQDAESAANELVERAIVQLRRRLVDQRSFRFRLVDPDLSRLIEGDSIRLIGRAYTDGYGWVDVNEDVLPLEVPASIDGSGITVEVQATAIAVDRWPRGGREPAQLSAAAVQRIGEAITQLREIAGHEQPVPRALTAGSADNAATVTSPIVLPEGAAPATPSSGSAALYALADGRFWAKDDTGQVYEVSRPTVSAHARTSAAQSIPNGGSANIVNFGTVTYDSHSAITTGASWHFTVPVDGTYHVAATIMFALSTTWAAGEQCELDVYKNGSRWVAIDRKDTLTGASQAMLVAGSTDVSCVAGDTLDIRVIQASGAALSLFNSTAYNHVSIHRV